MPRKRTPTKPQKPRKIAAKITASAHQPWPYVYEDIDHWWALEATRDLLGNTAAKEIHPFPCRIFHKGTVEGSVAKASADYVAEVPDDVQEVVLATQPHHEVLGC